MSYELAHNIIYSGLAFAEEYGFRPHKDYTSVTRFILEEDTESIEEIDIECGVNGLPAYMTGLYDSEDKRNRITAQLERTAGKGNYIIYDVDSDGDPYYDEFDEEEGDDDDIFDEEDEYDDESSDGPVFLPDDPALIEKLRRVDELTFEEKLLLLPVKETQYEEFSDNEAYLTGVVTHSLVEDLTNGDMVRQYQQEFEQLLSFEISDDFVDHHTLGLSHADQHLTETLGTLFSETVIHLNDHPRLGGKFVKRFAKESNGIPAAFFLELLMLQINRPRKFMDRLQEYAKKYPDYHLIRMMAIIEQVLNKSDEQSIHGYPFGRECFFPGRTNIHTIEFDHFLMLQFLLVSSENNLDKLKGLHLALDELKTKNLNTNLVRTLIIVTQYEYILDHYLDH